MRTSEPRSVYAPDELFQQREEQLLAAYAAGRSPLVLEQLVERYRPLARSLALRYKSANEPIEDLFQVAELGLVKAVQGFDPDRGRPFTAYAVPTILGEVKRHFRDRVWNLRLPRGLQEATAEVASATARLTERLGRPPAVGEIAAEAELDPDQVLEALAARQARHTVSLDTPYGGDDEAPAAIDTLGSYDSGYDRVEADFAVANATLEERERLVLELSFERGMTQTEIGAEIGVSQMQVSRISRKALGKLLAAVQGEDLAAAA